MDSSTQYLQWGFIQISFANLIVIGLLIVVFALAVVARWGEKNRASTIEVTPDKMVEKAEVKV